MRELFFLVLLSSCQNPCYQNYFENISSFEVSPNVTTQEGFQVDTFTDIDLERLDSRLLAIETCFFETTVGLDAYYIGGCLDVVKKPIDRECLVIKVVEPHFSKCSDWQLIGIEAPAEYCREKGIEPTEECPCNWRTTVQDDNVVITPPALYLWEVLRVVSSCTNIWATPLAECNR